MGRRKPNAESAALIQALRSHVAGLRTELRGLQRSQRESRGYDAGGHSRLTEGWVLGPGGPNSDMLRSLQLLRKRHQDLVDSNPWASRAIRVICSNWVGQQGILGQPRSGRSSKRAEMWREWTRSTACDWHGINNFAGLQNLWARTIAVRGSVLIRRRFVPELADEGLPPLQLETLEPDMLNTTIRDQGVVNGIVFGANGKPTGYHLRRYHPLDSGLMGIDGSLLSGSQAGDYVDRADLIHAFDVRRPGQVDGVPWGVAAMLRLRDLGEYESAELLKQKIAACFAVFVTDVEAESDPSKILELETLEPGAIENLPPGHDVKFAEPPTAGDYKEFVREQLHAIAAGYGVTFEGLTGVLSDVNYSSSRVGWLEFNRNVARWRYSLLIPQVLDRVARWFDESLMVSGSAMRAGWQWTPPRRELLDPSRDVQALVDQIRAGFISLSEVQRSLGFMPSEVLAELRDDLENAQALGLALSVDGQQDVGRIQAREFSDQTSSDDEPTDEPES